MFSLKQDCWARRYVLLLKNKMALELVDFQKGVCDGFIVVLRPEFGVQCSRSKALLPFSSCLLLREQWVGFWLLFISWRNRNSPDIGHDPVPMLSTLETSAPPRSVWSWLPQPWLSHSSQQHTVAPWEQDATPD